MRSSISCTCFGIRPPDRMVSVHTKILSSWIAISVAGVCAFFWARTYVEGNRKQAMLARQRVNFKLEEELKEVRAKQEAVKKAYVRRDS